MAVRRPSICLFCQARQSSVGRRKAACTARRGLQTITTRIQDDGFLLHSKTRKRNGEEEEEGNGAVASFAERARDFKQRRDNTAAEAEALRQAIAEYDTLNQQRAVRLEVLRRMRNPFPPWNEKNVPMNGHRSIKAPSPPEAAAAPVPHSRFRQLVREADGSKAVRQILRAQLLRCEYPRDILRIAAVSMNTPSIAKHFGALTEPIVRAMYRCRNNVSDPEVLRLIKIIATRFDMAGLGYGRYLLFVGLKFAARARSLPSMKWFLRRIRADGEGMSSQVFRSVIAKFSIGHRGLGEIRNGRWRRDELIQVLTGFDDCVHLPPEQQYHLGSFLDRRDWQFLHGWIAVLARCRDYEGVWREWEMWRSCPARTSPKGLNGQGMRMTTKLRGDHWFVEQMSYTKDLRRTWKLFEETGLRFVKLKPKVKSLMLEGIEYVAPGLWDEQLREAMVWKYEIELGKVEKALGVTWSNDTETHTLIPGQTQEESLERLAAHKDYDYGFPYDDDIEEGAIVESRERALHDAEEAAGPDQGQGVPLVYSGRYADLAPHGKLEAFRIHLEGKRANG